MEILKGRDDGFQLWRDTFDFQGGSIWTGLDNVLEQLGDSKSVVARETYESCMYDLHMKLTDRRLGAPLPRPQDLHGLAHLRVHGRPEGVQREREREIEEKVGLEGYHFLSRKYGPVSATSRTPCSKESWSSLPGR